MTARRTRRVRRRGEPSLYSTVCCALLWCQAVADAVQRTALQACDGELPVTPRPLGLYPPFSKICARVGAAPPHLTEVEQERARERVDRRALTHLSRVPPAVTDLFKYAVRYRMRHYTNTIATDRLARTGTAHARRPSVVRACRCVLARPRPHSVPHKALFCPGQRPSLGISSPPPPPFPHPEPGHARRTSLAGGRARRASGLSPAPLTCHRRRPAPPETPRPLGQPPAACAQRSSAPCPWTCSTACSAAASPPRGRACPPP